jgi:glycosyltransferase domain-containing protein
MSTSVSSSLTIILTLKDREAFTRRWMHYMNDCRCPYKILIADGGADMGIESELRNKRNYSNLDYDYIRYPYDRSWRDFYSKQLDVCKRVETKYVLFADNDDFYLLDKIPNLIEFLDCNPGYSGCRGSVANLFLLSADGSVKRSPTGATYRLQSSKFRSIEESGFSQRAETFFNEAIEYNHWMNWYCILRGSQVCKILELVFKHNFDNVVLNEILFNLMILKSGKLKVFDNLFYIRQCGTSQGDEILQENYNTLELFLIQDAFHSFNEFMRNENLLEGNESLILLNKAFATYIGTWCNISTDQYRKMGNIRKIKDFLKKTVFKNRVAREVVIYFFYNILKLGSDTGGYPPTQARIIEDYVLD